MKNIVVGIDAGTSVIKSVAFTLSGEQIAVCSVANVYESIDNGGVEQDMEKTWQNTLSTLLALAEKIDDFASRVAAIAVTGQGDGTWLIDDKGSPVSPAWLWLDARAASIARELADATSDRQRFEITGTGVNACQQGPQLLWLHRNTPSLLKKSAFALHCKDWLYYKLTGECFTDPSEGCFTYGDFRTRHYSSDVLEALQLSSYRSLLPPILDGVNHHHTLSREAASATGLPLGTPIVLGYVDIITTALGAGLYDPEAFTGCTIVGSTGVHMGLARKIEDVSLNDQRTGYTMPMPVTGVSAMIQTNMASTINIDWLLDTVLEPIQLFNQDVKRKDLISYIDTWVESTTHSRLIYQPYISEAGERGPFIDSHARAGFVGLSNRHGFPDMVRSVIEGLAFAAKDCYSAMGGAPHEIRLTGGAARSQAIRSIFGSVLGASVRTTERQEAGAAGAAMIAAVSIGVYSSIDECVREWVQPLLGQAEAFDHTMHEQYQQSFARYVAARHSLSPVWADRLSDI